MEPKEDAVCWERPPEKTDIVRPVLACLDRPWREGAELYPDSEGNGKKEKMVRVVTAESMLSILS